MVRRCSRWAGSGPKTLLVGRDGSKDPIESPAGIRSPSRRAKWHREALLVSWEGLGGHLNG